MRERRGRVIKEHVSRTHGPRQKGLGLRVGGGVGGVGGSGGGKWRQLYLKNYKKMTFSTKKN